MKYAVLQNNRPIAFYDDKIHAGNIPTEAKQITDTDWQLAISNPDIAGFDVTGVYISQSSLAASIPNDWQQNRAIAYNAKGWKSQWDLIDDILIRGLAAVKTDRDAIKLSNPKT